MSNTIVLASLAAFAVTGSSRAGVSIKDLSVEDAREHVKVVDGNTKKPVEGFQGLTLKLSKVKVSLAPIVANAQKLQVANEQVEEVSAQLLAAVKEGQFDTEIKEALTRLNEVATPKSAAAPADDLEGFEEDEADIAAGDELAAD